VTVDPGQVGRQNPYPRTLGSPRRGSRISPRRRASRRDRQTELAIPAGALTLPIRLCREWNKSGTLNKKMSRCLTDILGPGWSVRHNDPESEAPYYRNVIELNRILFSPYWRSLILDEHLPASTPREPFKLLSVPADFCWLMESTPGIELFAQEIRRTINPTLQPAPVLPLQELSGLHQAGPAPCRRGGTVDRAGGVFGQGGCTFRDRVERPPWEEADVATA
jgi:hypothetical protein